MLALAVYLSIHILFYEITYDRDAVTLPRWWDGAHHPPLARP